MRIPAQIRGLGTVAKRIAIVAMLGAVMASAQAGVPGRNWESLKSEPENMKTVVKETEIEVKALPGTLVVVSNRPVQVKVFTILGQLVSSDNIGAGVSRFQVNAHGVYIIKIGDLTCKVAL